MDNFDDLSNEQLRLKLLEYGLANMPVTQTTRKVLIKKLKNHIENSNTKVRRETIHVTKYSSDEDGENGVSEEPKKPVAKKETNRRATIGGSAAKLSKTLPVLPKLPPPSEKPPVVQEQPIEPSQKRRSGRTTPILSREEAPVVAAPKESAILENSDDDEEMPLTQLTRRFDRKSKSKSPSLSRAEMVTTSYVQVSAQPAITEEMEIDLTESTDEIVEPPTPVYEPEIPQPKTRPMARTPPREPRHRSSVDIEISNVNKRTTIGPSTISTGYSSSFGRPSVASPIVVPNREEVNYNPTDSPYLSEFTKRLSRLKAESAQINAVRDHPIRRTIASSYASPSRGDGNDYVQSRLATMRGGPAAGTANNKGEIRASLQQVILALDQKYSIRKAFFLLIVAMIVVFLFVFFFM
ncbi:otefin [Uranotaenia lowii]|uniref:otefin n=1 Tax=Uranotaenia lowii TaxID=190385 RepID=UPI002479CFA8|nr:otefin [Uranotaenia lowii]